MRPEQRSTVEERLITIDQYGKKSMKVPRFLWNAKCVSAKPSLLINSQKLSKKDTYLYFPFAGDAWKNDLTHVDFKEWRYYNKDNAVNIQSFSSDKPCLSRIISGP